MIYFLEDNVDYIRSKSIKILCETRKEVYQFVVLENGETSKLTLACTKEYCDFGGKVTP